MLLAMFMDERFIIRIPISCVSIFKLGCVFALFPQLVKLIGIVVFFNCTPQHYGDDWPGVVLTVACEDELAN